MKLCLLPKLIMMDSSTFSGHFELYMLRSSLKTLKYLKQGSLEQLFMTSSHPFLDFAYIILHMPIRIT